MATRVHHVVHDDFDASTEGVGTYRFALEGREYEIDLSQANLARLRAALAPFIAAGRRLPKSGRGKPRTSGTVAPGQPRTAEVRQWWATNRQRLDLPEPRTHGAIPSRVRAAYDAAHPADAG